VSVLFVQRCEDRYDPVQLACMLGRRAASMENSIMIRTIGLVAFSMMMAAAFSACSTTPKTEYDRAALSREVDAAIAEFKRVDPSMAQLFSSAKGYAVFPTVGKGELFEGGMRIGNCDLSQATLGFQLGGQAYSEVIFFETDLALETFKQNKFAFAAQASAVAAASGSSADADYENGVLVFTMAQGGLMFEASIGGQRFRFEPSTGTN